MTTTTAPHELPSSPAPTVLLHAGVGLAAGAALWLLIDSDGSLHSAGVVALLYGIVAATMSWILWHGAFARETGRAAAAVAFGLLFAGLGAHAGSGGRGLLDAPFVPWVAAMVLAFVALCLVAGFDRSRRRFDYAMLFDAAWRNAIVVPLSGLLCGLSGFFCGQLPG